MTDLIVWIHANAAGTTMQKIGTGGYRWRDTLFEVMRDFAEKRTFLLNALHHTSGHDSFVSYMERINIDLLTAEVKKSLGTKPLTAALDCAIRIYCYGTVRRVFDWLTSENPIPPADKIKHYIKLYEKGDKTISARRDIMLMQKERTFKEMDALKIRLSKIDHYTALLSGEKDEWSHDYMKTLINERAKNME